MNRIRYTFIFLILFSLFPCHGLLADEKTNNITENVTETVSTSTTENESKENHVNIKPQKKENIFIQIMKLLGSIILIKWIPRIGGFCGNLFVKLFKKKYKTELGLGIGIIYFILAIVLKACFKISFKISFFWSAIITLSIVVPVVYLIVFIIEKRNEAEIQKQEAEKQEAEIQKQEAESQRRDAEIQRLEAESQRRDAESQRRDAEIQRLEAEILRLYAMRKNEVERDIDELLGGYIDTLEVSIQKKELPDVQMVSELSKILDSILNKKSYISKEYFNKVRDDNEVFIKHILEKCSKLENFSGSLLETRINQVREKFAEILK